MGIVAAAVVGEVLLRGGEVDSAVPTKVPGNLERTVGGGVPISVAGSHPLWGESHVPHKTPVRPRATEARPPRYLHGSLGAGSVKRKIRGSETPLPSPPPPIPGSQNPRPRSLRQPPLTVLLMGCPGPEAGVMPHHSQQPSTPPQASTGAICARGSWGLGAGRPRWAPAQLLLEVQHVAVALGIVCGLRLHELMEAAKVVHLQRRGSG